jgi:hypothetical protein
LNTLDIEYGFIGGAAVAAAANHYGLAPRQTVDIDLIVQPATGVSATTTSERLNTDPRFSTWIRTGYLYGTPRPQVIVRRGNREIFVDIEIFDYKAWPLRQDYYDLDRPSNSRITMTVEGRSASFLNMRWLLRQKIASYPGRSSAAKIDTDMQDIDTLCQVMSGTSQTLEVTVLEEVTALKTVYEAAPTLTKDKLRKVVNCPQVFFSTASSSTATTSASAAVSASGSGGWTWNKDYQRYYRYDEAGEVIWA